MSRRIDRALISVSDKTGIEDFARGLADLGVAILSTGGTARSLRAAGIEVVDVSEHTGSPEILDGRVKTLHPKIHGGILGRRGDESHRRQVSEQGIDWIDLVCVNLYPFAEVTARGCSDEEAIENIDIGGPSMVRSAAKNHGDVAIVVDPADYPRVLDELRSSGNVGAALRRELAVKAFRLTASYDGMIADYLGAREGERFGQTVHQQWHLVQPLRYGENPHLEAAFYRSAAVEGPAIASAKVLQGKELSYNNIVDADAALQLVIEFEETACVAIKHTNPCGAAVAESAFEAFEKAKRCDPVSIFGGIVAFNRPVDEQTAQALKEIFLEIVIAPSFSDAARAVYDSAPKLRNVRLLEVDMTRPATADDLDMKRVTGGLLLQSRDRALRAEDGDRVVTKRQQSREDLRAMDCAWKICKHVKSNAIVLAHADHVVGVGAGQMSRVDAARIAVARAREHGMEIAGAAAGSDAFFPFRDGLDVCAEAGATAVIQPGGSKRDAELVAAADEHGMAMVMTGMRHFRH